MGNRFTLAELAIELDENGEPTTYWIYNYGWHPGQGGMEFCYGNIGTPSLESALEFLAKKLDKESLDTFLERIKERNNEKK